MLPVHSAQWLNGTQVTAHDQSNEFNTQSKPDMSVSLIQHTGNCLEEIRIQNSQ